MFETVNVFIGIFLPIVLHMVLCFVPFWGNFKITKRTYLYIALKTTKIHTILKRGYTCFRVVLRAVGSVAI